MANVTDILLRLTGDNSSAIRAINQTIAAEKQHLNQINQNINTLKTQSNAIQAQITAFTNQRNSIQNNIQAVQGQNAVIQSNIAALQNQKQAITGNTAADIQRKQAIDASINSLNAQKIANQNSINTLNAQKTALNGTITGLNAQKTAINTNINTLNSQSQAINNNINSLQNQTKELTKSQGGFNLNTLAITAMTTAVGALTQNVANLSMEFDKQLRNVNSLVQASEDQFKQFGESIKELSRNKDIVNSPVDLAKAMYQLVSSGFDAENALKMVGVASKAASAGLTTTETSVTALSSLMNAYNRKTLKDSIEFSDQLFRVVDKGVISFEQLSSNLGSVNAVAAASGVQFKEVGAAFIELTRAGISASESETAISNLIRSIADPSKEAAEYAKLLGVELGDTALQTKGLSGVLDELSEATNGSLSIMSKLIPESRAAKAALNLAKDGATGFTRALGEMETAAGSTDRALSQQSKSFDFQMRKMKQSIDVLKIEFGDIINTAMMPFVDNIRYMVEGFVKLDKNTKENIVQLGLFTIGLGAALGALKLLNIAMGIFGGLLTKSNIALTIAVGFFYSLDKAIKSVSNATDGWNLVIKEVLENFTILGQKINLLKGLEEINLFGKVGNYIEYKKQELELSKQENEQLKTKENSLKTIRSLMQKERSGQVLSSTEQKQYSEASTNLITFASNNEAKKRLRDQAIFRKKLSDDLLTTETANESKAKQLADKKAIDNKKRLEKLEEDNEKQKELDKKLKEKQKKDDEDYKSFKIRINDEILKNTLSSMDYELAQVKKKRDEDLKLAKTKDERNKIEFVYQKDRKKILDEYAKVELQKEQEQAKLVQKINDDITSYVKDETKKRQEQEQKDLELQKQEFEKNLDLRVKVYKDYLKKIGDAEKTSKEASKTGLNLAFGSDIEKYQKSSSQADFSFSIGDISLEKRDQIINNNKELEALNYETIAKNYKTFKLSEDEKTSYLEKAAELRNSITLNEYTTQKNFQDNFIGSTISSLTSLGQNLESSNNQLVNSFGKLSNFVGQSFNQIKEAMTSTDGAIQVAIGNITKSLEIAFSNFDKQNKSFDTYNQAVKEFGRDSQEAKDAILTVNESISDSFRALPGIIGEPLAQLTRMFTDFIGLTESAADKTKKALDTANFKKLLDNLLAETNKVIETSDQLRQLDIDNIEDEKARKEAQLNYDISIIEKSSKFEAVKIAEIKKLKSDYSKWLNEYNKDLSDKAIKENEDNIKKIRDTNEANYKSELSIIDKFYGEKRRKLEQDVQKEIDIIQSKNDRLKAIDDERNQTDADKKKRLHSFNQSLSNNTRTADFYRSNVEDFEVGFGGISNQRKQLEADYQAGTIDYETYAKKRTEIGLKQFQYYTEQSKRISDPKEKQDAIDKATQGQQEYYDFIFDKEKEKVENETKQAQIRLDSKRIELAKITEIEKQEIAKLDQAYKDSSGLYKDSFVNATQVWVQFAQDSINNIDLSNLINKVKNDINQAKQELGLVTAKTGTGTTNTPVTTNKSGYSTGGNVGPLLPDGAFYSKDSSFGKSLQTTNTSQIRPMRDEKSEQQKKNELISKLVVNPMFGYSFDNYINQSLSWLENQAIRLGIPLMAKGGVTNGLSIAGEAGSEAIYNYSQMKDMYDFVKRTTSNSSSNYNSNSNSINIVYSPVFTGIDLAKSGQVDNMIKSNFDSLKRDIIKASGGR